MGLDSGLNSTTLFAGTAHVHVGNMGHHEELSERWGLPFPLVEIRHFNMTTGCLTMRYILRFVRLGFHTDVFLGDPECEHQERVYTDVLLGDAVCEHQGCVCTDVLLGDPVCEHQERVCIEVLGDPECENQECVHTSQAGHVIH